MPADERIYAEGVYIDDVRVTAEASSVYSGLSISAPPGGVPEGEGSQLLAIATRRDGSTEDVTSFASWTAPDDFAGTGGWVYTQQAGLFEVSASFQGMTATAQIMANPVISSVTVSPSSVELEPGNTIQATAVATSADGSGDATNYAVWTSSNPAVATVSRGLITAVSAGTSIVTAETDTRVGRMTVTVTAVPVASLAVVPANLTIDIGAAVQLHATATLSDGTIRDVTTQVQWASAAPSIATVPAGLVHGLSAGTTTVSATYGAVTANASVIVQSAYTSLMISPSTVTLTAGQTRQLAATATRSNGTTQDVTSVASWSSTSPTVASVSATGLVSANAAGTATIAAAFSSLNASCSVTVQPAVPLPPDPASVAPMLSARTVSSLVDEVAFLYSGPNAIQTGVAANVITEKRVSVFRGAVIDATGQRLSGVQVSVLNHPEYGQTLSRADGMYDIAANGGGVLTVRYEKIGYIPVQRRVSSVWNQQNAVDDVALIPYDSAAAVVTSSSAQPQIMRGSASVDSDGTRRATVVVPASTSAGFRLTDGTLQSVASLTVRATEFTVGANGKAAMPAILPPTSGYTYCVELSADETPAGASVEFSKPASFYVENFLSLPVGLIVPAGYYDRNLGSWISSENGRVIKVLSVVGGLATIDGNGDGAPDDATQLAALGIDDAERQQIAALYAAGQTIWRVRITHFTPWDLNLPVGPPSDATGPNQPRPQALWISPQCSGCDEVPNQSLIDGVNQSLSEEVPIVGTPFSLLYDSKRMGRAQNRVDISLSGAAIPASLHGIDLTVSVAGQVSRMTFAPQTNLKQSFQWDTRDVYGRDVQGAREATVTVAWRYPAIVLRPQPVDRAWATTSDQPATDRPARGEYIYTQSWTVKLGEMSAREAGFGAWTFSGQQMYDGRGGVLYDAGETRAADPQQTGQAGVFRVAGNGQCCDAGDGVSATSANINPWSTAIASDGSIYLSEGWKVKKVDTSGVIRTIAGTGLSGFTADGAPAAGNPNLVSDVAVGPDDALYLNDVGNLRVRHVVNGLLKTVAGNGQLAPTPMQRVDGVLATTVPLYPSSYPAWNAGGIAVGPDGTLYIAEKERVTAVGPDGIIHTIAGPCTGAGTGDGGPAVTACVAPQGIAVGPDGSVFISDDVRTVRRITPDGKIDRYAGTYTGTIQALDGGLASAGSISQPRAISVAPDGTLLIGGWRSDKRIRAVGTNGIITTFAGKSGSFSSALEPDGSLARGATMSQANDVKVGPDGSVLFADSQLYSIRKTAPLFPRAGSASTLLPSSDGTEGYVFENGRHVRTVDTLTGVVLFTLAYDTNGYLATITDRDGNVTSIERDAAGGPTAIVAPGGQRTLLTVSGGYLTSVSNPAGESQQFTYDADGLLQSRRDARGNLSQYTWDESGRLQRDADPAGGSITLARSGNSDVFTMTRTTAEGRSVQHAVTVNPDLTDTRAITLPSGLQTHTSLDGRNLSLTSADGTSQTTSQAGDPRFGMRAPLTASATLRAPSGLTMQIGHTRQATLSNPLDPLSVTRITDTTIVNGRNYLSVYDATLRQFSHTTPAGRTAKAVLDAKGRVSSVQRPGFATRTLTYDPLGRLSTIASSSRTLSLGYNSKNQLTSITDPLQRTLSFAYDGAGRLVTQTLPDGRVIQFAYDANGNVTSVTPPSRPTHGFEFTAVNLTSKYSSPDPSVTQYAYNRDRQLTLVTKPDATTIAFAYDNSGRLSTITTAAGTYQYAYSSTTGNLASITTPEGNVLSYTFDGNLLTRSQWSGAISGAVALAYDSSFRVSSENGAVYAYDPDSLLVTAGALSLRRDAQTGLLSGTTLGGVTDGYAYNEFGEATHYAASAGGNPVLAIDYTRDAAGRISSVAETMGGTTSSQSFTYDAAGRLTDATNGASTTHYTYDGNGNRLSRQSGTLTETGTYDASDRVLTYGDATYTYTANGELKTKVNGDGTTTYVYDAFGNLQKVTLPDGTLIEYVIDGQGRRIEKKVDGQFDTGWIYGDQNRIVAQTDSQGNINARYVYGSRSNVPDYVVIGSLTLRIVSDHVGSPRFVINSATNEVFSSFGYDEFGNILAEAGNTSVQPFRFAGGLYDYDTGLLHFGAREYDPQIGRFSSKDPLSFYGGSGNLYSYAGQDPVTYIDPDGLARRGELVTAGTDDDLLLHSAVRIYDDENANDDTTYSHGGGAAGAQSTSQFITRYDQLGEPLTAYPLNLSAAEIGRLEQLLQAQYPRGYDTEYNGAIKNCAQSAGWAITLSRMPSRTPGFIVTTKDLLRALQRQGVIDRSKPRTLSMGN